MKNTILNFTAVVAVGTVAITTLGAEPTAAVTTNELTKRLEEIGKTGDMTVITNWLSHVETLWPQNSTEYEAIMERALLVLEKRLPLLLAMPDGQTQRNSVLHTADALGAVRALRIPGYNYRPRSSPEELPSIMARSKTATMNPDTIEEPELRREIQEAWKKYRHEMLIYGLQALLARVDVNATPVFLKAATSYMRTNPNDLSFFQEVANRIPLGIAERQQLENAPKAD